MKDLNVKDIQKAAFAVGLGFTVGKAFGDYINVVIDSISINVFRSFARHGNKTAQKICENCNIEYEASENNSTSNKVEMGFHA